MAVALRSSSTNWTSTGAGSTVAVTKPAGVVDGDLLVSFQASILATAHTNIGPPAGWTVASIGYGDLASTQSVQMAYKVASGEGASYAFQNDNSGATVVAIMAFSGVDTADPFSGATDAAAWSITAAGTSGTSKATPSITPDTADTDGFLVRMTAAEVPSHSTRTWTPPSGHTEIFDFGVSAAFWVMTAAYKQLASNAATGTANFTVSSTCGGNGGTSFVLRKAPTSIPKSANDSSSLTNTSALSTSRTRTDAGTLTNTSGLSTSRTRTDAAALAESSKVAKLTGDSSTLSESKALSTSRTRTDAGTVSESSSVDKRTGDAGALSESKTLATSRTRTDSAVLAEGSSVAKLTVDSVGLSEASGASAAVPAGDVGTLSSLAGAAAAASTGDSASLGELSGVAITTTKSSGDSLAAGDGSALSASAPVADAVGLDEDTGLAVGSPGVDSIALGESSAVDVTVYKDVNDDTELGELSGTSAEVPTGETAHLTDVATFGDGAVIQNDSAVLSSTSHVDASALSDDDGQLVEVAVPVVQAQSFDEAAWVELSELTCLFGTDDDGELSESASVSVMSESSDAAALEELGAVAGYPSAADDFTIGESASVQVLAATGDNVALAEQTHIGGVPLVWHHRLVAAMAFLGRIVGSSPVVTGRLAGSSSVSGRLAGSSNQLEGTSAASGRLAGSSVTNELAGSSVVNELAGSSVVNELKGSSVVSGRLVADAPVVVERLNGAVSYY